MVEIKDEKHSVISVHERELTPWINVSTILEV